MILVGLFFHFALAQAAPPAPLFRLHLPNEPTNLDPHQQKNSASSYLLFNLHRNVFVFDDERGLVPDLGESCERGRDRRQLTCTLKKNLRWSDGRPLTAEDFVSSYRKILDPRTGSPRADLLFAVKNAEDIYRGRKKIPELGVRALDERRLRFEFRDRAPDFEYNLTLSALAPSRGVPEDPRQIVVSGPYRLLSWDKGRRLRLTANPHYPNGSPSRPDVEFVFVEDDGTALRLYEKGDLDFLRRLPTIYISRYKKSPEFHWIGVTRLDYLGFAPKWDAHPELRRALSLSLDFEELRKIFSAEGAPPGCPGLPENWASVPWPCLRFDPAAARAAAQAAKPGPLRMNYSTQGGEDHRRAAEWQQEQWRKNAGLTVRVKGLENKIFLAELKKSPPDVFRKGLAPDRPTCYAALEKFTDPDSGNFLEFKDSRFRDLLNSLADAEKEADKKDLCLQGLKLLIEGNRLIPLGRMHFAVLAKENFFGWRLNQMNQLDLSALRTRK
ncbi:MAG: peptide ABC transporter substrate-binding protein [Bdellovibrionaceae bacterium]|nr:peptide ABC transporter substrate-binding protein [Pseudobdellovibrionaceae bacterium]